MYAGAARVLNLVTLTFLLLLPVFSPTAVSLSDLPPPPHRKALLTHLVKNDSFSNELPHGHIFRVVNRRKLGECSVIGPNLRIDTSAVSGQISDDENVTVTISGVLKPSKDDWVAMISPSNSNIENCPLNTLLYKETGDLSDLPLLCHYPVESMYLKTDPDYLTCNKSHCDQKDENGTCRVQTCSASVTFHVINIRTDIEFVLFTGGFVTPCILKRSSPLRFSNPFNPLYGHLSSVDSSATTVMTNNCELIDMRLTWVSGSNQTQKVQYGDGRSVISNVTTFTQEDMCSVISSPAREFGWHDPGYIHTALLTGLKPSTNFSYRYGSEKVGWSGQFHARTPPAGGTDEVRILAFGDMGKAPRDGSVEHYIQPGSLSVTTALIDEVTKGKVDAVFHIGDISYATGFLVEWEYFLNLINPVASRVSYMTAIGNHERDYINSGSVYLTPDSGGECGAPYETYFQMPAEGKDKPWYSIEMGSVHFTVISTEHPWHEKSEQYQWMKNDLASVDRSRTPWLIFAGHRPMYTSTTNALISVDPLFVASVEPLLQENKVDLAIMGHVHNYERACALYRGKCKAMPVKGGDGIDTYNTTNYTAPVHAVIGMAGFELDGFCDIKPSWSLSRISKYGYTRIHARKTELKMEFVNSHTGEVEDSFRIIK